jgi:murein endopeptidase
LRLFFAELMKRQICSQKATHHTCLPRARPVHWPQPSPLFLSRLRALLSSPSAKAAAEHSDPNKHQIASRRRTSQSIGSIHRGEWVCMGGSLRVRACMLLSITLDIRQEHVTFVPFAWKQRKFGTHVAKR